MCEETHCDRRRFLGTAAMTMAAARLGLIGAADAQPRETTPAAVPTMQAGGAHVLRRPAADRCRRPACRIR